MPSCYCILCTYVFPPFYSLWNLNDLLVIWILIFIRGMLTNRGRICFLGNGFRYFYLCFLILQPSTSSCTHHNYIIFDEVQVFKFGTKDGKPADHVIKKHTYILQPITGNAKYSKLRSSESANRGQPLQKASVNLDDVTLCLPKVHIKPHFFFFFFFPLL